MRSGLMVAAVLAIVSSQAHAWGQTATSEPAAPQSEIPRLSVAATAFAGPAFGFWCGPSVSDVVQCGDKSLLAGLRLSPRWRLSHDWALGFSAGVAWVGHDQQGKTKWWDAQFAGRYYLGAAAASQFWLDASAGLVSAVESLPAHLSETGQPQPASHISTWAPAGSLAIGRDAEVLRYLGVAPELRVTFFGLNRDGPAILTYRPQTLVLLGLSVVGFGFYR